MLGVVLAFASAVFEASKSGFEKHTLNSLQPGATAWGAIAATVPFLGAGVILTGTPTLGDGFWWLLAARIILDTAGVLLYMNALQASDLSLTIPFISFTPAFLLVLGPWLLGEHTTLLGVIGVGIIVLGSYVLTSKHGDGLAPFKAMLHERGPRLMLATAFVWGFTNILHKAGVAASNPLLWGLAGSAGISVLLLPLAAKHWSAIRAHKKSLLSIGLLSSLTVVAQLTALSLIPVAYAIAIKRLSILMSVIIGASYFKEQHWVKRTVGGAVMVAGAVLVTLS